MLNKTNEEGKDVSVIKYTSSIIKNNDTSLPESGKAEAVLTIEASLVLPIFILMIFLVLSVINVLRFSISLENAVFSETKNLALTAYEELNCDEALIKSKVLDRIDSAVIEKAGIKGNAGGIDFGESDFSNREIIKVKATYSVELPFDYLNLFDYKFSADCTMHSYTGYENGLNGILPGNREEEYVYITRTGTAYHRNRDCSYLRLSIRSVDLNDVKNMRNNDGAKYYPCEICGRGASGSVYITEDGNRYHSSLDCSGLKRTIMCVPISQVGGRHPCVRCGGK